ncbi:MAG: S8 family serine peptidase, partial [Candidatus Levybacteria bacterium]|nr:S8 family serine peptidase [Candidatus Levybacteria bacterium]
MGIILFVVVFASITPPIYAMSQGQNPIRMFVNQILKQNMEPKPVLGESKNSLPVEQKIQIVSNEFLVKFKSNRANNLRLRYEQSGKKGLNNTSNQQLDTTGSRAGLKNIEPVLKNQAGLKQKSQKVREKADKLNRWYKVQINVPKKTFDLSRDDFSTLLADPDFKKYLLLYRAYQASEEVEAVEHNYIYSLNVIPNDPKFPEMWGLTKINAASAWDQSTGLGVVVADIDTGINYNHPDLKDAIWINPAESGSTTQEGPTPNCTSRGLALNKSCNNIDDDGNGYVDDYRGWDFYNNDNNPIDDHGHGTHTSGTIAALGNNGLGVIGVSWNSKILPLKICNYLGSCPLDSVIKAISYSADLGVKVSSNSYGGSFSQSINDAMQYAHSKGQVIVASAGNNAADAMLNSPASAAQAITVASSNQSDTKSLFSNFGSKIDVTAPGESILSTCINSNYCLMSGTSMSAPHVSGLAALILAKNPSLTNEEVRQIIRSGADDVEIAGRDNNSGYGRINALKSLNLASAKPTTPFISSPTQGQNLSLANGAQLIPVMGTVTGSNFASYKLEIVGTEGGSWNTLASGTSQIATDSEIAKLDLTKLGDGKYTLKLSATNTQGNTFNNQVNIEVHNMDLSITYPNGIVSNSQFDIVGTASGKAGSAFSRYLLEWGVGISPASWFANGIILANNGTQSITNGTLGTFDPTVLPNSGSGYTLRLTVYNNFQIPSFRKVSFQPEAGLVNGWPKPYGTVDPYNWTSDPVVTDLDGDAKPEFITSAMWTNKLYAFRANGDAVPGWPVTLPGIGNAAPAVSDLDGDGKAEVVVNSSWMSSNVKGLLVFKGDGTPYPGWNSPVEFVPALNTPALADIDNDGKKEIINNNCGVHVYKLDGSELPGWPVLPKSPITVNCGGELFNSPVVADIDGDGYKEIIADRRVGSDSNMHKISVFRYNGQLMWEKDTNFSNISPAVADLDGDGKLEVAWQQRGSTGIQVFKHDGSNYPGAPFNITEASAKGGYLTMVDLDGDGKSEIISPTTTTRFVVLDYQGKLASGWDIPILIAFDGWNTASFGDFDG